MKLNRVSTLTLALVSAFCLTIPARAQTALEALKRNQLKSAYASAKEAAKAEPANADAQNLLGILALASGDGDAAESAFDQAIKSTTSNLPKTSGLERLVTPESALFRALENLKASVSLGGGMPSYLNNRGVARLLLGRSDEASDDFDKAAVMASDWGVPWVNGALVAIDRGDFQRAATNADKAIELGEKTAKSYSTLAEAEFLRGDPAKTKDDLDIALTKDPSYAYALLLQSQLKAAQAKSREGERALFQALAVTPLAAVNSELKRKSGNDRSLAGTTEEAHLRFVRSGQTGGKAAYRFTALGDQQRVEDRENGKQQAFFGEALVASQTQTFFAYQRKALGGRPGSVTSQFGLPSAPDANYDFNQTNLVWQGNLPAGGKDRLLFQALYRNSSIGTNTNTGAVASQSVRDGFWSGEGRFDHQSDPKTLWQAGLAFAEANRQGQSAYTVEPQEQALPDGVTHEWTAYGLFRRRVLANGTLSLGVVANKTPARTTTLPVADLSVPLTGSRIVHLGFRPRVNETEANFFPVDLLAGAAADNSVDRQADSSSTFNRSPVLFGQNGKFSEFELTIGTVEGARSRLETVIFQKRMEGFSAQGADPRLATNLQLSPIQKGSATGIGERMRFAIDDETDFRLWIAVQDSEATAVNTTYDGTAYPTLVTKNLSDMPNFPRVFGSAHLDHSFPGWLVSLQAEYAGSRIAAVTSTVLGVPRTFITDAKPVTGFHFIARHNLGGRGSLNIAIYNLLRANFYPGYPGRTTGTLGYEFHF